jgi:hypothetical protein
MFSDVLWFAFCIGADFDRLWCVYELASFCRVHRGMLSRRLVLFSLEWPSTWSPLKSASLSQSERRQLTDFSCLTAQCFKPADRANLLAAIRREWGEESKFDEFVHTELLEILEKSKASYMHQLTNKAAESLQLLLGD